MEWTIYDPLNGQILRSGASHDAQDAYEQMAEHESIIIGEAYRDDLFKIVDGKAVPRDLTEAELDLLKDNLARSIDTEAGFARSALLTISHGQDYVYSLKLAEAERVIRDAAPASEVPLIAAEAEADGMSSIQKASQIITAARAASSALASIEVARRSAKRAVGLAKTKAEAEAAAQVDWPAV